MNDTPDINEAANGQSRLTALLGVIKHFLGGGRVKYRVRGIRVEMKGGGTGPFWGSAHFIDFETPEDARLAAIRWAKKESGIYVP